MYLKETLIQILKVKNVVLLIIGIFLVSTSVAIMLELIVEYFGDWFTILHARATPECVIFTALGSMMITYSRISRRLINDAGFYASYFEGSLSGYISLWELAEVTGKSLSYVQTNLHLVRPLYMTHVTFRTQNGNEFVELYSKTCVCECRSCGAPMEKRMYFTGICPYCGSSDLFAKVVSGNRFYSISGSPRQGVNRPSFYEGRALGGKLAGFTAGLCIALSAVVILLMMITDTIAKYNDRDYLTKVLLSDKGPHSFALIQSEMMNTIIFSVFLASAIGCAVPLLIARLGSVIRAKRFAAFFSRFPTPYVTMQQVGTYGQGNPRRILKGIVKSLRERYLRNCSPEKLGNETRVGLAKQITKDTCPYCGAPIVGAASENYCCRYCRRLIMGVIRKR